MIRRVGQPWYKESLLNRLDCPWSVDWGPNPDNWEIAFETIKNLQWLGSGAQGAVFSGILDGKVVAVKKVREQKETDIHHLRKLNHPNIVQFRGVCTQAPCYCIVMEFCPYGPLCDLLNAGEEIPPVRLVKWAKEIASGMYYLHSHKIIHRDLKSPNVLIGANEVVKISDFGTSREWNDKSTKMTFAGTVAWMAPEIIRNEPYSEKVDIWSYGVVLWELLTCETPYKNVGYSAVMYGVASNRLNLPIPWTCPKGFDLLMKQCWSVKPRNRPSFKHILIHLDIASATWKNEIRAQMQQLKSNNSHIPRYEEELIKKRNEELKHAEDIREHYERKLDRVNNMYMEMITRILQLDRQKQDLDVKSRQMDQQKQLLEVKLHQVERWENMLQKREKKVGIKHSLLKADKVQKSFCKRQVLPNLSTPTSPEQNTSSPESPHNWAFGNPQLASLVLNGNMQPEVIVTSSGERLLRQRKGRHRRSGSGSLSSSTKASPSRNKKTESVEQRHARVDQETQTEMEISETDTSPTSHLAPRRFPSSLSHSQTVPKKVEEQQRTNKLSSTESLNGNTFHEDTVDLPLHQVPVIDDEDDDPNSNIRLSIPECSDDDHLESLGRKVSEILNGNQLPLSVDAGGTSANGNVEDVSMVSMLTGLGVDEELVRRIASGQDLSAKYRGIVVSGGSIQPIADLRLREAHSSETLDSQSSRDDRCEDSWSEGEDELPSYNYSLRRRSLARKPIGPGCRSRRVKKVTATLSSEGNLSDEENTPEYSHPPSSQCSTLESNPDLQHVMSTLGAEEGNSPNKRPYSYIKEKPDNTTSPDCSDSESDNISAMTVATQLGKSPKMETVV
uniref:Protein kinase domain-containing protein n=1 Tax=Timema douglasi TaxID=61478 RepID=A0A7R8Z9M8_TIMDO|nr:unnamed protein product [Timema douglasi]